MSEEFDRTTGEIVERTSAPVRVPARYESPETGQFAEALAAAQGEMEAPKRTKPGVIRGTTKAGRDYEYKYSYAPFEEVVRVIREPLSKHGITYHQGLVSRGDVYFVRTFLRHSGTGQWIASDYPVIADRPGMQGFAGAVTYAKRYGLSLVVGLAAEDDDDGGTAAETDLPPIKGFKSAAAGLSQQATRAYPKVAEPSSERQAADEAHKKIAAAIDAAADRIGLLGIYDPTDGKEGKWGQKFLSELNLIRHAAPESLQLLQARVTQRFTAIAQAAAQKAAGAPASPTPKPRGRPPKTPPASPLDEPLPTPEEIAAIAKQVEAGIAPDTTKAKADHRAALLRMAREAALTAGRQGLRHYSRGLADADYNDNTAEWEDIKDEVIETVLPIADRFDQGSMSDEEKTESEQLLAALRSMPKDDGELLRGL